MITMTAVEIAALVGGTLHGDDVAVTAPATFDSRQAVEGGIFLALVGEKSDGHDFIENAFENGSVLAFTTRAVPQRCIIVEDVLLAIGKLARYVRGELRNLKVIAITGSQGKTTTKDLLGAVLAGQGETVATQASFNNEIGLPITLLRCTHETKYCVVEMGARHSGDIAALCAIAQPDIGVVLKVGTAHLGEFGSVEAIASTKSELVQALGPSGIAILGSYDDFTPAMSRLHTGTIITFGEKSDAMVRASDVEIREGAPHFDLVTPAGREAVGLHLIGAHQVANALAAAAVCTALHIPLDYIASALSTATMSSKWRMEISEVNGLLIINDSYNANPDSMEAALRSLILFAQERGGQSWAFVGKMHELGASSRSDHEGIGTLAQELGIDHLIAIGCREYGPHARHFDSIDEALALVEYMSEGDVVLFKASRAEKFEEVAESVTKEWMKR